MKLLLKLMHHGFDNNALNLISNYFQDRFQTVKFDKKNTLLVYINIDVLQDGVLGPLFKRR